MPGLLTEDSSVSLDFVGKIDHISALFRVLDSIRFKSSGKGAPKVNTAIVSVTEFGIKFTLDQLGSYQAHAQLGKDMFGEYTLQGEMLIFRLDFDIFMDCLTIFGTGGPGAPVAAQIAYQTGADLVLLLDHQGILTQCNIHTAECQSLPIDFAAAMRGGKLLNKAIFQAAALRDALNELDWSQKEIELVLSPDKPFFRVSTSGVMGSVSVEYANDSEVFESFDCKQTRCNSYDVHYLQPAVKALSVAEKCEIRQNEEGLLLFKHLIRSEDRLRCSFVDFFCVPFETHET